MDEIEYHSPKLLRHRIAWICGLAVAYAITGWLGLLLAIPPGYATAVFPAAGIGLAVLLVRGVALWPGVWLGSALLNILIALFSPAGLSARSAAVASLIGVGAALQAALAVLVVRRVWGKDTLLDDGKSILLFLLFTGPVACLISATIGVTTLYASATIPANAMSFSFWTWWVGDSIGVVIGAPIALMVLRWREQLWKRRLVLVAIPALVSTGAAIAVFLFTSQLEEQRLKNEFNRTTATAHDNVRDNIMTYLHDVESVKRFVAATGDLSREKFNHFTEDLIARRPGIQGLSWDPRVTAERRRAFESGARREGYAGYRITERDDSRSLVSAGARAEYFPVFYLEPLKRNKPALGFDVGSNPVRMRALTKAMESNRPTATGRITLVQETGKQSGILLFNPVYNTTSIPTRAADRREALKGFAVGILRVGTIVDASLANVPLEHILMEITDVTPGEPAEVLYRTDGTLGSHPTRLSASYTITIADRQWEVGFKALPAYEAAHKPFQAWLVLAGALMFVGLLQAYLLFVSGNTDRIRHHVSARTRELAAEVRERERAETRLRAEETRLSGVLNTVVDGIITINQRGIIDSLNPAAQKIFGWEPSEIIGRNVKILMPEPDHSNHDRYLSDYMFTGRKKIIGVGREVTGKHRNGTLIPLDLSVSEMRLGDTISFVGVMRDISERKAAETAINDANLQMKESVAKLQWHDREMTLINRMSEMLMACGSVEEAYQVVRNSAQKIFSGLAGALAIHDVHSGEMKTVVKWGDSMDLADHFPVQDCWGVRKGMMHDVSEPMEEIGCRHVVRPPITGYMCRPLQMQNNLVGVLTVECWETDEKARETARSLILSVGETIKLALSNLMLREALHDQATRDTLTGLLNRRAMDQILRREISRAKRAEKSFALAILDVDFFKRVNDTFGHDAGDEVLRRLGSLLATSFRDTDNACRFGGEEFVVIMSDTKIEDAVKRMEEMRLLFSRQRIVHGGESIGPLTLSAGIAAYGPAHETPDAMLSAADEALYQAKEQGRNRVIVAAGTGLAPDGNDMPAHRIATGE